MQNYRSESWWASPYNDDAVFLKTLELPEKA